MITNLLKSIFWGSRLSMKIGLKPLATVLAKRPRTVLLVYTIITILIGLQASNLIMQSELAGFLPKDDPTIKLLKQVYDEFQIGATIIILVETDDIRNPDVLKEYQKKAGYYC